MKYFIKQRPDKSFTDKMDLTRFIQKNFDEIKRLKLSEYKTNSEITVKSELIKDFTPQIEDITSDFIEIKSVINTTNIIDSHQDLHTPKIWNKTVIDNPYSYHLKQHEAKFESVISSKAKSYNEDSNFNLLGLNVDFKTVANINQFFIGKDKNPFMFKKYVEGEVKEHSVGMMYVAFDIAYYDEDSQKNMDYFESAKKQAVNPEVADEYGYVWVVHEARKREGSAVVFGSNSVTPTLYVKNYEPPISTRKDEPPISTHLKRLKYLKENY